MAEPSPSTTLVIPLRSNAASLVAGAPVAAMRRKLKMASLVYDEVLLETGTVHIQVGPHGSVSMLHPPEPSGSKFQSARHRASATASDFHLSIGEQESVEHPAPKMVPLVASPTTIHWIATLDPFRNELPAEAGWIEFVVAPPVTSSIRRLAKHWKHLDETSRVLERRFDDHFVRSRIIEDTNNDLALVASARAAMMADRVHGEVLTSRLEDAEAQWNLQGFAVPVLLPRVGELSWSDIATARRDRGIVQLRTVWKEIEQEALTALEEGNDLDQAVQAAYVKRLESAGQQLNLRSSLVDVGVGVLMSGAGYAAGALLGPAGAIAGAVGPTAISSGIAAKRVLGRRAASRWLALNTRLRTASST